MIRGLSRAIPSFEELRHAGTLAEVLRTSATWGYRAVEPMICRPCELNVTQIASELGEHGLDVSGFRTGLVYARDGLSLSARDESIRKRTVERLCEVIEFAAAFPGATVLNGLVQGPPAQGVSREQAIEWIEEGVSACCARAREVSVVFCLEAVNRYELPYHNTVAEVAAVARRIPGLRILVDTFHMNIEEVDVCAELEEYGALIAGIHLADSGRGAPGSGHLDFAAILSSLDAIGFDRYATVELGRDQDSDDAAREAVIHIESIPAGGSPASRSDKEK